MRARGGNGHPFPLSSKPIHLGPIRGARRGCAQLIPLATMQPEPCFVVPTLPSLDPGLSRPLPPPVSIPDSETRTVQQDSRAIKTTRHLWLQNLLGIARQVLQSDAPHLLGIARPVLVRPPRRSGGPKLATATTGSPPRGRGVIATPPWRDGHALAVTHLWMRWKGGSSGNADGNDAWTKDCGGTTWSWTSNI